MENNMYSAPLNITGPNSTVVEEIRQHSAPKPLIHCYSFDLNNQNHIINGITVLAGEQGEPTSDVHADGCFLSPHRVADSNSFVTSQGKTIVGDTSNPINNNDFQEHVAGGMPIASASLSARIGHQENLENSAALPPSICSLEALGPYIFNNWQDTSNPLSATFGDHAYDGLPGIGKWHLSKFLKAPDADGTEIMAYSSIANLVQHGWTSSNVANMAHFAYNSSNCSNELSLSLAKSPTTGQCFEMSCSDASHNMNGPTNSGLEQPSCSSKELSMRLVSNKHVQLSPTILGSRYLAGIQEILAQIATYSLENIEQINYSAAGVGARGNSSASDFTPKRRVDINQNANSMFEAHVESPLQRQATDSNKSQLLMLLQLVDNGYSKCLDEIHTVISAFHAVTELDPHMHAHFALQMISFLHKDLRERISNCMLAIESDFNSLCSEEKEWSIETSFIQKQWALQQLKRKDQLWRPQRGLPERSVSVLRAWLFQNFLHPYPKDVEKHLLAVRSGLTRSQVSNWFINARVRLWKPMIEEMYAEMSRSKACRNDGEMEITQRSRISMHEQSNVEYQLKQKKVT